MVSKQLCSVCKNIVRPGIDKFVIKNGKIVCKLCHNATRVKSKQKYNKTGEKQKKKVMTNEEIDLWNQLGINIDEDKQEFMDEEINMEGLVECSKTYLIERLAGLEDFGEEDE